MVDFVSDLNGNEDVVVSANTGSVNTSESPAFTPPSQATKVDAQQVQAEKPTSLRDQISSALKGETDTPLAAQAAGMARRNPDGTFAPAPVGVPAASVADQAQAPAGTAAASQVAVPAGVDPQVFQSLPAETQASLARTMDDLNNRQSRIAGHEVIEQIIAPRRQAWHLNGMTEAQAVNQLFALSDMATNTPKEFIQYFAQQSNIDLEELVFGTDPGDPEVSALKEHIQRLEHQVNGFSTQQQQAAHNGVVNEIVDFASEKSADGNLARPYFEQLGNEMMPLIQSVLSQNPQWSKQQVLQEAYDRACWGNPQVRAKMQEAANANAEAERIRQSQNKAHNARNAGSSVANGVPAGSPPAPNDGTMGLRDTIRASLSATS